MANYRDLSGDNRHKVDLMIAMDFAETSRQSNKESRHLYESLKTTGTEPEKMLTTIRDSLAEEALRENLPSLKERAEEKGIDARRPFNSYPDDLRQAAELLAKAGKGGRS